jgi:glycosyltransferase involved in cell wall biosynthesis
MPERPLRILFAAPAWWPAVAFGGPIPVSRELTRRLVERGHDVEVVTTTLVDLHRRGEPRTRVELVDGARVRYLATPLSYRWMGITPTLPAALARIDRPDVVHLLGLRDVVTTTTATWARLRRIPYVLEPLGMFRPRLRKVALKRGLDSTLYRGVAGGAAAVVAASSLEGDDVIAGGVPPERVEVRGNGFPAPTAEPLGRGPLRRDLGIGPDEQVILYTGRIAAGKGIELLLDALAELPSARLVLAGPDDRHGAAERIREAQHEPPTAGRVHVLGPTQEPPAALLGEADVVALVSEGESFGMAAAEAAAAGVPVVVSDRCGVRDFFRADEALVVPYEGAAVTEALRRILSDPELRSRLGEGGRAAARRMSWEHVVDRQEEIYRAVVASTAASTRASTDGP